MDARIVACVRRVGTFLKHHLHRQNANNKKSEKRNILVNIIKVGVANVLFTPLTTAKKGNKKTQIIT